MASNRLFLTRIIISSLFIFTAFAAHSGLPTLKGGGRTAVYIEQVGTGRVLADDGADTPMIPASILKAVTTASVLSLMSPQQCYATTVGIDGVDIGGRISGNLVIRAVGDPTLESPYFPSYNGLADSVAVALKQLGITAISGTVRIDTDGIAPYGVASGWNNDDLVQIYGAPYHPATWRANRTTLTLPGLTTMPYVPGLQASYVPGRGAIKVVRDRETGKLSFSGAVRKSKTKTKARSKGAAKQEVGIAVHNPDAMMQHEVVSRLRAAGIAVGDSVAVPTAPLSVIYTHVSPTFADIMKSLMFRSDNLMAEALYRSLAPGKSRDRASDVELKLWNLRGVDTVGVVIDDGSGLSRDNRVTAVFMGEVLNWMAESRYGALYASFFPRAGMEGTMRYLFRDTPLHGCAALKTGTMKGVRCLAGYILDREGLPEYLVVIMANDYKCSVGAVNKWMYDVLEETLAKEGVLFTGR